MKLETNRTATALESVQPVLAVASIETFHARHSAIQATTSVLRKQTFSSSMYVLSDKSLKIHKRRRVDKIL